MYLCVHTQKKVYAKNVSHIYIYVYTKHLTHVFTLIFTHIHTMIRAHITLNTNKKLYVQIQTGLPIHTCVEKKQKYVQYIDKHTSTYRNIHIYCKYISIYMISNTY